MSSGDVAVDSSVVSVPVPVASSPRSAERVSPPYSAASAHGGGALAETASNGTRSRCWILTLFDAGPQEEKSPPQSPARSCLSVGDSGDEAEPASRRPRYDSSRDDSSSGEERGAERPQVGEVAGEDSADRVAAARFGRGVERLIISAPRWPDLVVFFVWQVEKCPDTG